MRSLGSASQPDTPDPQATDSEARGRGGGGGGGGGGAPRSSDLLRAARERERAGAIDQAIERYRAAIAAAETAGEWAVLAEALRRLAIVHQQRDESAPARELCHRSYDVACRLGDDVLAAEAMNTLGGLHLATGSLEEARSTF